MGPAVEPFMEEYGDLIDAHPQDLADISLDDLKEGLRRMSSSSAGGLDGWRVSELKGLPDCILELLLLVYDTIETEHRWPSEACWGGITLIPKGEGGEPLKLRPLSVMNLVYRLWASVRMQHCSHNGS